MLPPAARDVRARHLGAIRAATHPRARSYGYQAALLHRAGWRDLLWLRAQVLVCPSVGATQPLPAGARLFPVAELCPRSANPGRGHREADAGRDAGMARWSLPG